MLTPPSQHEKASVHHDAFLFDTRSNLNDMVDLWRKHGGSGKLSDRFESLLTHGFYTVGFEMVRQQGGLPAQKAWARDVLEKLLGIEDLQNRIRVWLIEQGEDAVEVEKLGKEAEVEDEVENEDNELDATEVYDWTSTSTLE